MYRQKNAYTYEEWMKGVDGKIFRCPSHEDVSLVSASQDEWQCLVEQESVEEYSEA